MATQYGFLINMEDCYGCKTCAVACKSENQTPAGVQWRRVREFTTENPNSISFLTMSCNHCDEPQCMEVCPVSAYSKRDDGIVVQDHDRCVGCRMCLLGCPYGAPQYDPVEGKTSKCNMCVDRIDNGQLPRCVEACPAKIIKFGEISELRKEYGADLQVIEDRFNFPNHKVTGPNIVILPPRN